MDVNFEMSYSGDEDDATAEMGSLVQCPNLDWMSAFDLKTLRFTATLGDIGIGPPTEGFKVWISEMLQRREKQVLQGSLPDETLTTDASQ